MTKSRKLIIYEDKKTGSLFIRSTRVNDRGQFVLKDHNYGKAISGNVSNDELGRVVREILQKCE